MAPIHSGMKCLPIFSAFFNVDICASIDQDAVMAFKRGNLQRSAVIFVANFKLCFYVKQEPDDVLIALEQPFTFYVFQLILLITTIFQD